ncbi:hypothetical protein K8T06_17110 [bacterium]|nr:hypothetical protein [bacterium]
MSTNLVSGIVFKGELPDWDHVIVFIHKLRPFQLKNESTYFPRVCNVLSRRLDHSWFKSFLEDMKNKFDGSIMQNYAQLYVRGFDRKMHLEGRDEFLLNSEEFMNIWLNAFEYHHDERKRGFLNNLHKFMPEKFTRHLFLHLLKDKAVAIINVCNLIEGVIGKTDNIDIYPY